MQTRHLWIWLLLLLAVALPVGIEARGGKKRVRNKRRQTTVTNSARRLVDAPPPQVLHKEPWLEYRPEFLSVAECQELLRLADNAGSQWNQGAIPGALQSFALSGPPIIGDPALTWTFDLPPELNVKYFPPDAVAESPLLQAIDARIREWTGTLYDGAQITNPRPAMDVVVVSLFASIA